MQRIRIEQIIPADLDQRRLDQALAVLCPEYSRSQIQHWIRDGRVAINAHIESKPRAAVRLGQQIIIDTELSVQAPWLAQDIPLSIVYADEDLLVINKPAGLVVHPGAGNPQYTLVNALLHYDPSLAALPRAGLVHRLDKETSGLLVVARHLTAHHYLIKMMQQREIKREYVAIVHGLIAANGVIRTDIGRHPTQRTKMSVVKQGKPAVTHYHVIETFGAHTHLHVQLETGRTHQIRVHLAHIGHPLVGDPEYGSKKKALDNYSLSRQALHAVRLSLAHPRTGEVYVWTSPLPEDLQQLLQSLKEDTDDHP